MVGVDPLYLTLSKEFHQQEFSLQGHLSEPTEAQEPGAVLQRHHLKQVLNAYSEDPGLVVARLVAEDHTSAQGLRGTEQRADALRTFVDIQGSTHTVPSACIVQW